MTRPLLGLGWAVAAALGLLLWAAVYVAPPAHWAALWWRA